ncbi:LOW QUALITY PROTEIN: hypothetical protein SSTG_03782, partial [Streptomyces sp. e14]
NSLEAFLDSIGSSTSPQSARHQVSDTWCADLPTHRPTPLPRDNHRPGWTTFLRHPITHLLTAWFSGSTTPRLSEDAPGGFTALASRCSMFDASQRVPEYQPVIHRLRLSASP